MIYERGTAAAVLDAYRRGGKVVGICGGYQMMGRRILDPDRVEGERTAIDGLGLLPLVTEMREAKVVCQSRFRFRDSSADCCGYQIHMGETTPDKSGWQSLNTLPDGAAEGYWRDARCWGTYMHGILDNPVVLDYLAEGLTAAAVTGFDYFAFKERQYDLLADHVRGAVDLEYIYSTLYI